MYYLKISTNFVRLIIHMFTVLFFPEHRKFSQFRIEELYRLIVINLTSAKYDHTRSAQMHLLSLSQTQHLKTTNHHKNTISRRDGHRASHGPARFVSRWWLRYVPSVNADE